MKVKIVKKGDFVVFFYTRRQEKVGILVDIHEYKDSPRMFEIKDESDHTFFREKVRFAHKEDLWEELRKETEWMRK